MKINNDKIKKIASTAINSGLDHSDVEGLCNCYAREILGFQNTAGFYSYELLELENKIISKVYNLVNKMVVQNVWFNR